MLWIIIPIGITRMILAIFLPLNKLCWSVLFNFMLLATVVFVVFKLHR